MGELGKEPPSGHQGSDRVIGSDDEAHGSAPWPKSLDAKVMRMALDLIPGRVFWKDRQLIYRGCNTPFAQDAAVPTPTDIEGVRDKDLWPAEAPLYVADDLATMESGQGRFDFEEPQTHTDGETIWLKTSKIPIRDDNGEVVGVLGFYNDITAHKRAEFERDRARAQLKRAQKLDVVGKLAGGLAHDFNNMLTAVLSHAELLLAELDAPRPDLTILREDTQGVREAAERAASLTQRLLQFSRRQVIRPQTIQVGQVVDAMREMLSRLIREDIALSIEVDPSTPTTRLDVGQFEQALMNLVVNARDAMPQGGSLQIRVGSQAEGPDGVEGTAGPGEIGGAESVHPAAGWVLVEVQDDGVGIKPDIMDRIFEPFFTTKGLSDRAGLGLSTAEGIIAQSGGAIRVRSVLGAGTTIRMFLPALPAEVASPSPAQTKPQTTTTDLTGRRILLVEDDDNVRALAARVLKRDKATVITAANPHDALVQAYRMDTLPDAIVTDIIMPIMNGRQMVTKLEERWGHVPVLYMSGYPADIITEHGVLEEGLNFISKPFELSNFIAHVRALLRD